MSGALKKNDRVVIIYDYTDQEYEDTDATVYSVEKRSDGFWCVVERWDGTYSTYHEGCIDLVSEHYKEKGIFRDELPTLPKCECPVRTLMIKGCVCGGV